MMKNGINVLILAAAIITVVSIISRAALRPIAGLEARAMIGFAGLLLLFAIALEGRK